MKLLINLKEFVNKDCNNTSLYNFIHFTKNLDAKRNENFSETFPEYKAWWENINSNLIELKAC